MKNYQKRLQQYDRHNKMRKEKEQDELEMALQSRRQLISHERRSSYRKNYTIDIDDLDSNAIEEEKRIAEEFQ